MTNTQIKPVWTALCLVTLLTLTMTGCGQKAVETGALGGKVTFDDTPVTTAKVQVQNESGAAFVANTNSEGKYSISTPLPVGKYTAIVVPNDEPPPAGSTEAPPKPKEFKDIPEKYRQLKTSGLTTTVNKGSNTFDIPMTSK